MKPTRYQSIDSQSNRKNATVRNQMSQQPPNPFSNQPSFNQPMQPERPYGEPPKKDNVIGLTGFIVSLVGLFLCGVPSVIGLIVSAIGLKKEPRGLAIAGVIIGIIGMVQLVGVCVIGYQWTQMARQGYAQISTQVNSMLTEVQLEQAASEIGSVWQEQQQLPTQEEGDEILIGKTDRMNNPLVYETDGTSFSVRAAGADGILDTQDDIVVGPFEDPQTAIDLKTDFEGLDLEELTFEEDETQTDSEDIPDASESNPGDLMEN